MLLRSVATFGCCLLLAGAASAQDKYPSKPIRLVVSFAVGGPTDIVACVIGAKMSELLGQQIVVDNRPGAGGNLGADAVAKAAPDGYTLLMATVSTHAINPGLYKKMPYDPVKDFEPIAQVGVTPTLLVAHPSVPAKDAKEMVALLKANPGKYSYGSSGLGSILHLCGEQFKTMAGNVDMTHVPYRGSGPMMNDLTSGQVPMAFDGTIAASPSASRSCPTAPASAPSSASCRAVARSSPRSAPTRWRRRWRATRRASARARSRASPRRNRRTTPRRSPRSSRC